MMQALTMVKECVEVYLHFPNTPSRLGAQLKLRGGSGRRLKKTK
jgi:hypothetical protein